MEVRAVGRVSWLRGVEGDEGIGGREGRDPGKRPQVASRPGASDSACTASPGQEVEEIPEEWNLYYPMQLDLAYGRSSWDDYKFDIDEGKNRDRSDSEHCMGWGAASTKARNSPLRGSRPISPLSLPPSNICGTSLCWLLGMTRTGPVPPLRSLVEQTCYILGVPGRRYTTQSLVGVRRISSGTLKNQEASPR